MIDNFSILDEKFISNKYKNKIEVQFNRKKILNFFEDESVIVTYEQAAAQDSFENEEIFGKLFSEKFIFEKTFFFEKFFF